MRRLVAMIALHAVGLVLLGAAALVLVTGRDATWALVFGKPDLGRVDFATLVRSATPNDALVCPRDLCRAAAPDIEPPVFAVPPAALREALRAALAGDPLVLRVAENAAAFEERYVARTPVWRFPDTVRVRYLDRGAGRSTLALYGSSQIGRSDTGVNRARLADWLFRLTAAVPLAKPGQP